MTETQHTPGPWTVSDTVKENGNKKISNARHLVAIVGNAERAPQRFEADAKLIAAAPEMLEALTAMLGRFGHHEAADDDGHGNAIAKAQAAVARATASPARYQIQVEIGYAWECGEWIECTENGITGERIEATHATRAEAQAELDDMFEEMERQGMDFARSDWRVAKIGGAA